MESVAQNNLSAHFFQAARHDALHSAIGPDRHEDGCLNQTVVQAQLPAARVAVWICFEKFKLKHVPF